MSNVDITAQLRSIQRRRHGQNRNERINSSNSNRNEENNETATLLTVQNNITPSPENFHRTNVIRRTNDNNQEQQQSQSPYEGYIETGTVDDPTGVWACEACTFRNGPYYKFCMVCGTPKKENRTQNNVPFQQQGPRSLQATHQIAPRPVQVQQNRFRRNERNPPPDEQVRNIDQDIYKDYVLEKILWIDPTNDDPQILYFYACISILCCGIPGIIALRWFQDYWGNEDYPRRSFAMKTILLTTALTFVAYTCFILVGANA